MSSLPDVVIPVKDRLDLTKQILKQLRQQGEHGEIYVFDNGSAPYTKKWLTKQKDIHTIEASGLNIHEMWNAGLDLSNGHVAILNNDLNIGPHFLSGLAAALDSNPELNVVCPNYDGRPGEGVQYTVDICADRYDGTGGLAGFAFMLRDGWNYRFPEMLRWWCGDNHMVASVQLARRKAGIVLGTTVEHINGGGQTGNWDTPEQLRILETDLMWWLWWQQWIKTR